MRTGMQAVFTIGEEAHAWFGSGAPILVTITRITATQITATDADGKAYRFRARDHREIGWGKGGPQLKPMDHAAAERARAARELAATRRAIFGVAGALMSPDSWSSDPQVMMQLAGELHRFLDRVRYLGVELPSAQQEWLERRAAEEAGR